MLKIEIEPNQEHNKYGIKYIAYIKGFGSWKHPINNYCDNALTKEEASFVAEKLLKTLEDCLVELGRK